MHVKIKKHFLKIFISVFAVVSTFIFKGFWNESLNLKNIDNGSRNLFKDIGSNLICVNMVRADTTTGGGDNGIGDSPSCGGGGGSSAGGAGSDSSDGGSSDSSDGGCGSCD